MLKAVHIAWIILQIVIGFHLFFPLLLLLLSKLKSNKKAPTLNDNQDIDFAIIITAYEETINLPDVVNAILKQAYQNYTVYLVADKCDTSTLFFNDERVNILLPPTVIGSNTGSHAYAMEHFKKQHDVVTIIDSDNIIDPNYLLAIKKSFDNGFTAVQGLRAAKNLDTNYACLDAARDIYYHFYDGEVLFKSGSSATLAGSAMAFKTELYREFLTHCKVSGAGFDKVLQHYIVKQDIRIAFNKDAILLDQKTTHADQLVKQRSRWINTWFKYFNYGFGVIAKGVKNLSVNQFVFGIVLLRPPLFIFLILSVFATLINLSLGLNYQIWLIGFASFIIGFFISLKSSKTDQRIYASLVNIPKFMFFQLLSLSKVRNANKISVATKHQKPSNEI
ncbi:glycosyltransferase [Pedobacter arcticus]|uniref:glycosyltransferase n=1 Tax=Pedobacter arcticus TaxID=752140 RepID=UPI0002D3400E|nr:glycosyltransferase [Pedobacter arcticus]